MTALPKVSVVNRRGETVEELELPEAVYGRPVNEALLHQALVRFLANQRQGTSAVKNRAAVAGGGRKPWRQKGTGRARQGSIRSPLWRSGGVAFGPVPREFRQDMPKKARRAALCCALSARLRDGELVVLDELVMSQPKTREMAGMLAELGASRPLLILPAADRNVALSARNLPGVRTVVADDLCVYDVLAHPKTVLTREAALRVGELLG